MQCEQVTVVCRTLFPAVTASRFTLALVSRFAAARTKPGTFTLFAFAHAIF
jgi:hypothetical protein